MEWLKNLFSGKGGSQGQAAGKGAGDAWESFRNTAPVSMGLMGLIGLMVGVFNGFGAIGTLLAVAGAALGGGVIAGLITGDLSNWVEGGLDAIGNAIGAKTPEQSSNMFKTGLDGAEQTMETHGPPLAAGAFLTLTRTGRSILTSPIRAVDRVWNRAAYAQVNEANEILRRFNNNGVNALTEADVKKLQQFQETIEAHPKGKVARIHNANNANQLTKKTGFRRLFSPRSWFGNKPHVTMLEQAVRAGENAFPNLARGGAAATPAPTNVNVQVDVNVNNPAGADVETRVNTDVDGNRVASDVDGQPRNTAGDVDGPNTRTRSNTGSTAPETTTGSNGRPNSQPRSSGSSPVENMQQRMRDFHSQNTPNANAAAEARGGSAGGNNPSRGGNTSSGNAGRPRGGTAVPNDAGLPGGPRNVGPRNYNMGVAGDPLLAGGPDGAPRSAPPTNNRPASTRPTTGSSGRPAASSTQPRAVSARRFSVRGMGAKGGLGILSVAGLYYGSQHFSESYQHGDVEGMATSGGIVTASSLELGSLALGSGAFGSGSLVTGAARFMGPAGIIAAGGVAWYENGKWIAKNNPLFSDRTQFDEDVDMRNEMYNQRIQQNLPGINHSLFSDIGLPLPPDMSEYKRLNQIARDIKNKGYTYTNGESVDLEDIAQDPENLRRVISHYTKLNRDYYFEHESSAYWKNVAQGMPIMGAMAWIDKQLTGHDNREALVQYLQSTYQALDFSATGSGALRELNGLGDNGDGGYAIRGYEERMNDYVTRLKPLESDPFYSRQIQQLYELRDISLLVSRTTDMHDSELNDAVLARIGIGEERTEEQKAIAAKLQALSRTWTPENAGNVEATIEARRPYTEYVSQLLAEHSVKEEIARVEAMGDYERQEYFEQNKKFIERLGLEERQDLMVVGLTTDAEQYLMKRLVHTPESLTEEASQELVQGQEQVKQLEQQIAALRARAQHNNIDLEQYQDMVVVGDDGKTVESDGEQSAYDILDQKTEEFLAAKRQEIEQLRSNPNQTPQDRAFVALQETGLVTAQINHLATELENLNYQFEQGLNARGLGMVAEEGQQVYVSLNEDVGSAPVSSDPLNSRQLKTEIDAMEQGIQTMLTEAQSKYGEEKVYEMLLSTSDDPEYIAANERVMALEERAKGYEDLLATPNGDILAYQGLQAKREALTLQRQLLSQMIRRLQNQNIVWQEADGAGFVAPTSTPTTPTTNETIVTQPASNTNQQTAVDWSDVTDVDETTDKVPSASIAANTVNQRPSTAVE